MTKDRLKLIAVVALTCAALLFRLPLLSQVGKDYITFQQAVNDLLLGVNPYIDTIRSFQDKDTTSGGYAYFPGLLFTFYFLYVFSFISHLPVEFLWKIPNLLAELGVAYYLYKILNPKGFGVVLASIFVWLFNPYLVMDLRYTYTDAIPVFFMLASVYYLEKDSVISGALFALSVMFKPFPLFAFPVFLLIAAKKTSFLSSGALVGLAFSLPFMKSFYDFVTYIRGSLFVHEGRSVTGRPFLFYISYYGKLEFIQLVPLKIYTFAASFLGWLVTPVLLVTRKTRNPYILITLVFSLFYIFTPVLNRTYLLWFIPFFVVSLSYLRKNAYFYIFLILFYAFYSWYLWQWIDGFHITRPW